MSIEIPLSQALTVDQAIAAANAAKISAQQALANIPAVIDAEVGPASAPYIAQAESARDAAVVAKTAAETARDNALATERRMRQQSLGQFANDAAAEAWAAAQSPAITIITGSSYLNTTSDIFRYAVVSAGPTIVWHDVTEDEAAQAVLAQASATAAAASLSTMLTKLVGAFSTDPTYVGGSPPWVVGALYFNTTSNKLKVWTSGAAWAFYDAAAQTAATNAAASEANAGNYLGLFRAVFLGAAATDPVVDGNGNALTTAAIYFNTVSGKMRTRATGAWVDYDKAAQDAVTAATAQVALAIAQAGIATTKAADAAASAAAALGSYNNTNALLSSVLASAILAAAQRAIKISTALVAGAAVAYDTTKDEVSDWPRKCVSQSYLSDTLNTATRGTVAAVPAQMVVMGETTVLSVFMGTDGLGALWKSWTVAGLTCVFARSGSIWYGATGGLYRLDLITDEVFKRDTSGLSVCTNQKVADYNQGTATWALVSSAGAIASATVNSIAATVLPPTPANPLRCGLPNPTVAVGTGNGVSVIRWDGVVCSANAAVSYRDVAFDPDGNLAVLYTTYVAIFTPAQYSVQSWYFGGAQFTSAQMGVGTPVSVRAIGRNFFAIAGSGGLCRIKLDPTNPAQSLYSIKTSTYDTGWMVLGKTVLAMAESSANLSSLSSGTASDRSGSGNNPTVNGTVTRAVVASGADCAGYSNLGGANYLEVAANSALDFGTGDWGFAFDIIAPPSVASLFPIASYGNGSGAGGGTTGWGLYINGNTGAVILDIAGTYAAFNDGSVPLSATAITSVEIAVRSGYAELTVNGVRLQRVSTSGASATCVGATLRFMNWANNSGVHSAATIGSVGPTWIGNFKLFSMARTPDFATFAANDNRGRFVANAKELLSGANVQAVAFDPDTNQLAASNSTGGTDVFAGPGFSVRVANQKSTTGANLIAGSSLAPSTSTWFNNIANASVGNQVSAFASWGGGVGWELLDTASNITHLFNIKPYTANGSSAYGVAIPLKAASQGIAAVGVTQNAYATINLATGAVINTFSGASAQVVQKATGEWLAFVYATPTAGSQMPFVQASNGAYAGAGTAAIIFGKPMVVVGSTIPSTYVDGLTTNDNHKAVAFAGGDLVVATGAGVDAFLAVKPGLRETAGAAGSPRRPFYDPTWGQFYGLTTDATPTVFASIPIPKGKAYRFRASVVAVMYGGTATEKAVYDITGVVSRDIGGNVVVVATTTTVSEVTSTMDCVAQANTTAQTLEIKATGKASTRIAWFDGQELYDVGLMAAA